MRMCRGVVVKRVLDPLIRDYGVSEGFYPFSLEPSLWIFRRDFCYHLPRSSWSVLALPRPNEMSPTYFAHPVS